MSASLDDPFDLKRFVAAQQSVYQNVLAELRDGCKQSHWMWFIFPQLKGLGQSAMALRYGIASLAEAQGYLGHRTLGPKLLECTRLVNAVEGRSAEQIFGYPDDLKFRSSMTLFARAAVAEASAGSIFTAALEKFFHGKGDEATLARLK